MLTRSRTLWICVVLGMMSALVPLFVTRVARFVADTRQHEDVRYRFVGICIALVSYDSLYRRLPLAKHVDKSGNVLGSWRFAISGLLESNSPNADFDAPWNAPANQDVVVYGAYWYCNEFCATEDRSDQSSRSFETNVFGVTGPGTPFDEKTRRRLSDIDHDTILFLEVRDSGVHWAAPGDLDIRTLPESITVGPDGKGIHVAFADRHVWYLNDVPLDDLKKFLTVEGAKNHDRETVLGPYATWRSRR